MTAAATLLALAGVVWVGPGADDFAATPDSVHALHRQTQPRPRHRFTRELDPPSKATEFTTWVYGYYATWAGEVSDLQWDRLTHVAIFDVELTSSGGLTRTANWTDYAAEAVALGEPYGVKIHLAVTCFSADVMAQVLDDPGKRVAAADALAQLVHDYGGHGVSVDFEGMAAAQSAGLVAFVQEVKARVDEVTVATPAVDWNGAYDYDALVAASDGVFLMGYDYHWGGGNPGPVAPLFGQAPWGQYSLEWSLTDHETWGAPPENVILGLPLYGRSWPSTGTNIPGTATGTATSLLYADAVGEVDDYGRQYDVPSDTAYYFPSGTRQNWYDDTETLDAKIAWAVDQGVRGIGFWALNYEAGDPEFWDMVAFHTQTEIPDPGGTTGGTGEETGEPPDPDPDPETTSDGTPEPEDDGSSTGDIIEGTTGTADTDTDAMPEATEAGEDGCGCQTQGTPTPPAWLGAGLLLLALRRRPSSSMPRA